MIKLEFVDSYFSDLCNEVNVRESTLDKQMFVSEESAIKKCAEVLKSFYANKLEEYKTSDDKHKIELLQDIHTTFCDSLDVYPILRFKEMCFFSMGYYNPETNTIVLNESFLADYDPEEILLTELHELRHCFQERAVKMPFSVDVDDSTIKVWKDNLDNYISPKLDLEAYSKQPVEVDADNFAALVYDNAINGKQV